MTNILLVDDDAAVNFLNKFLLTDSGISASISVTTNGLEALNSIKESRRCPDVIFLDINMPVMDGLGFLEAFKEYPEYYPQAKVYILTSSLRESDKDKASSYACVADYLEKPLTAEMIEKIFS